MFARIGAKFLILVAGGACVFFGIGLLALGVAFVLAGHLGTAAAYALTGCILLLPVLVWGAVRRLSPPPRPTPPPASGALTALIGAVARETPWLAVVGAGLAGMVELFLNRKKSKPKP